MHSLLAPAVTTANREITADVCTGQKAGRWLNKKANGTSSKSQKKPLFRGDGLKGLHARQRRAPNSQERFGRSLLHSSIPRLVFLPSQQRRRREGMIGKAHHTKHSLWVETSRQQKSEHSLECLPSLVPLLHHRALSRLPMTEELKIKHRRSNDPFFDGFP